MAEGSTNKVKISDRDKKVLYIVAGIVILALAYFMGFQKMMASRSTIVEENITLETEVNKLLAMVADKARVESETQEYLAEKEKILANYPPELRTQDVIYQLDVMEQTVKGLLLETEAYTMNQIFFANGVLTEVGAVQDVADNTETSGESAEAEKKITGYRSDITTNCSTNYKSLKDIVNFINENENRMVIQSITVSQGEGSKKLACNMSLSMYAVGGTEKVYEDPKVAPGKFGGKDTIFTSSN